MSSMRAAQVVGMIGVIGVIGVGCVEDEPGSRPEREGSTSAEATVAPPLRPPAPFVMAADGVTELDLEQAGILKPGGDAWARVMGKALFWDLQAGSDGNACASCHFHAGADARIRNQLNPGFNDVTKGPGGDTAFGSERSDLGVAAGRMPSGAVAGANYTLTAADLPLHRLSDESDRNSAIITTTNDRVSSLGAYEGAFTRMHGRGHPETCGAALLGVFRTGTFAARQVEPRHTPSSHNAAFSHRNFWDNRANNLFNGVGVFGLRDVVGDPNNRLVVSVNGVPTLDYLKVENASTASQAVGPPLSALEMSCGGRSFPAIGRKLLGTIPLFKQQVSKQDSVLGPYVSPSGRGLRPQYRYDELIRKTFDPKYWALPGRYRIVAGQLVTDPQGYTQMELNFSMFWGLSIAAYEATQVSDQTEFDVLQAQGKLVMRTAFVPAGPPDALGACSAPLGGVDPLLVRGCTIFARFNPNPAIPTPADGIRGGNCFVCHNTPGGGINLARQPLLTEGAVQHGEPFPLFLTVGDVTGRNDLRDNGSANIGLRNVHSDKMSGTTDPYGHPLSFGRQLWNHLDGQPGAVLDPPLQRLIDAGDAPTRVGLADGTGGGEFRKLGADGASKVPILRNVALTPPYFSWGGYPSLRQVLKVYNRGMNRRDITGPGDLDADGSACTSGDDSGTGPDGIHAWPVQAGDCSTNTTGLIVPLGLSDCDANGAPNGACIARGHTVANDDIAALTRFLESLTDRRVQCDQAPFDHPALTILDGHSSPAIDKNNDGKADDVVFTLPAVGAAGYAPSSGLCIPNAGDLFAPGMQARAGGPRFPLP